MLKRQNSAVAPLKISKAIKDLMRPPSEEVSESQEKDLPQKLRDAVNLHFAREARLLRLAIDR